MDVLFKQVFNHVVIRKQIFYQVLHDKNCRSKRYNSIHHVYWIIKNGHLKLLAQKLRHNDYLLLDQKGIKETLKLKDIGLFIMLFNRFRSLFIGSFSSAVERAAGHANWPVVQYLVQQENYPYKFYQLLEIACTKKNYELAKESCERARADELDRGIKFYVSLECFVYAIGTKDIRFVNLVFEYGKDNLAKESKGNKEKILVAAIGSGGVEIFRLVRKYFEDSMLLFSLRKSLVYNKNLLWKLYSVSVGNYECYRHIYDNFDLSFTANEEPPHTILQYPVLSAVEKGSEQVVHHLLNNHMVAPQFFDKMPSTALNYGHFELYEFIKRYFNLPLYPLPSNFNFYSMKDPIKHLEQAKYAAQYLGVGVVKRDIEKSTHSLEVFKFMYERYKGPAASDREFINNIISYSFSSNNVKVIEYLLQRGLSLDSNVYVVWSNFLNIQPSKILPFFQVLLPACPPTKTDIPSLVHIAEHFAGSDLNRFKSVFEPLYELSTDNTHYTNCFLNAVRGGRISTLHFLFSYKDLKPTQNYEYIKLLEEAAVNGDLAILKYIIENHFRDFLSHHPNPSVLYKATENNHIECVEYLFPIYDNFADFLTPDFLASLGSRGNLLIIKYLSQSLKNISFGPALATSIYTDVIEYLKSRESSQSK
ncbi:hypothetical protein CYY_009243 [Polysphondylium violaceum]|uniref:Ankyrin repeat-containing protein n=1 Tax=Polysphondylium violaceum TaxID=133409 RepID=A0A8J4PM84_9MYCE|nr:hypothetical protein CYY_009243 [Polysphondylium violaceum]